MEASYLEKKKNLEVYFNRTALSAWDKLTSELPVSWVREKVRQGRCETLKGLLSILPNNLDGYRVLDAGCGTGQMTFELAAKGANVIGVDISEKLINIAKERCPRDLVDKVSFYQGDMLDRQFGSFDYVLLMDSLIHYSEGDIVKALNELSGRVYQKIGFTIVPKSFLLSAKLMVGQWFPKADKSPDVIPVKERSLAMTFSNIQKIKSIRTGFYAADVMEISK